AKRRNPRRGKQRNASSAFGVLQVEQQRRALIRRKLAHFLPQPLQKDSFFDLPRRVGFSGGARRDDIFILVGCFNRLISDLQQRGHGTDQIIEFNRATKEVENRRQEIGQPRPLTAGSERFNPGEQPFLI